jgi:hypothetical protein
MNNQGGYPVDQASREEASPLFLNDIWTVYFHNPQDHDWTYDSYVRLGNISTAEEVLAYIDIMREDVQNGMFFVMREHVFPCWDDPLNIGGTTVSMKILKDGVTQDWEDIMCSVLGETFLKDASLANSVNGISISPKRSFCIIKIWMRQPGLLTTISDATIPATYTGDLHCSANADNIKNNNARETQCSSTVGGEVK